MVVWSMHPWFLRGADIGHGLGSGVFAFSSFTGVSYWVNGFRVILAL